MSYKIKFKNGDVKEFDSLNGADLYRADLRGAILYKADLREANLREANLREADLGEANLREADLREANLREADLGEADLRGANLSGADLTFTKDILSATFGQHLAFAFNYKNDVYIKIGCECHNINHWMENFRNIGKNNSYNENKIKHYGAFIKYVKSLKGEF